MASDVAARLATVLAALAWAGIGPTLAETYAVDARTVTDTKAVYATVQAAVEVPARARIGGTLETLSVDDGSAVTRGEVVARIVDEKLALQRRALDAQIAAANSEVANVQLEYDRARQLFERGTVARSRLDQLETQLTVARNTLKAAEAQRAVLEQQVSEGDVLAPAGGRVLSVPVTAGSVVMAGEVIATVAIDGYLLRIEVPERHARFMKTGDSVTLGARGGETSTGEIVKIYPQIRQGRVVADARVEGLGDFFVGERVPVSISVGERQALVIPRNYVDTRFGLDFVRVERDGDAPLEVVVELGAPHPLDGSDGSDGVEVLSGLRAGDRLVRP